MKDCHFFFYEILVERDKFQVMSTENFKKRVFVFFSRPETSFLWFTSPWKTLKYIIWKNYKWYIIGFFVFIILALFIVLILYNIPVSIFWFISVLNVVLLKRCKNVVLRLNPVSVNPTKWSNIVWVRLTILWDYHLNVQRRSFHSIESLIRHLQIRNY